MALPNIFDSQWLKTNESAPTRNNSTSVKGEDSMLIPALISAAATVGTSIYNNYMQKKTNQQNQDYQTNMLQNRLQMTVGDAQKAGLSPLAALGAAPASVSATSQAPQLDAASLSDMLYSMASLQVERDKLAENKRQFDMTHPKQHDEFGENLANQIKIAGIQANSAKYSSDNSLEGTKYSADRSFEGTKYSADSSSQTADDDRKQRASEFNRKLMQQVYEFGKNSETRDKEFNALYKQNEKKAAADFIIKQQPAMLDEYKNMCSTLGVHVPVKWCDSLDEYREAKKVNDGLLTSFYTKYNEYVKEHPDAIYDSYNGSVSESFNANLGVGVGDRQNISEKTEEASEQKRESETTSKKNKKFMSEATDWLKNTGKEIIKSGIPSFDVNASGGYSSSEGKGYNQSSHLRKVASDLMRECGYQFVMLRATYKED